jgi:hypothetical protein
MLKVGISFPLFQARFNKVMTCPTCGGANVYRSLKRAAREGSRKWNNRWRDPAWGGQGGLRESSRQFLTHRLTRPTSSPG